MRWTLFSLLVFASAASAAPATQPATQSPVIAVLPFRVLAAGNQHDWIGLALQDSLVADLKGRSGIAITTAKEQSSYVVTGRVQVSGDNLRINGQVLRNGKSMGTLKAAGNYRELFSLEDILARQVSRLIPQVNSDRSISKELAQAVKQATRPSGPLASTPRRPTLQQTLDQAITIGGDYRSGRQHYYYDIPAIPCLYNSYGAYFPCYPIMLLPY